MGAINGRLRRHRRNRLAAEMYCTWTPRRLFTFGTSVGWAHWFDSPSLYPGGNHLYLYQDSAGTTPVTAVGQTIGLTLDRAYGGMRGPELPAPTASLAGGATNNGDGTFTIPASGSIRFDYTLASLVNGMLYEFEIERVGVASTGTISVDWCDGPGTVMTAAAAGVKHQHRDARATYDSTYRFLDVVAAAASSITFRINFARSVPGVHRRQNTSSSRPTLSARVNLLLNTEALNSASWTKGFGGTGSTPVVTDAYTTDDEGRSASRIQLNKGAGTALSDISNLNQTATGTVSGSSYRARFKIKATSAGEVGKVVLFRHAAGGGYLSITLTNSWQVITRDETAIASTSSYDFALRGALGSSDSADFLVSQSGLRTADDAAKNIPAYQRVGATAADHDTDGFPHYKSYDGTDDSDASVDTVNGSATDKVTVVTGMTKNSDAAAGVVYELTASIGANNGAVALIVPSSNGTTSYGSYSRGTTTASVIIATAPYAAPQSAICTSSADISADALQLRVNGVTVSFSSADQGTGNYSNATLYFGSRAGSSSPANIREYASIGRFGPMSDSERNRLESWVKNLMRLP